MMTKIVDYCSVMQAQGVSMASWMQWPAQVGSTVHIQYSVWSGLCTCCPVTVQQGMCCQQIKKGFSVSDSCQSA